jgi:hypothetical protein
MGAAVPKQSALLFLLRLLALLVADAAAGLGRAGYWGGAPNDSADYFADHSAFCLLPEGPAWHPGAQLNGTARVWQKAELAAHRPASWLSGQAAGARRLLTSSPPPPGKPVWLTCHARLSWLTRHAALPCRLQCVKLQQPAMQCCPVGMPWLCLRRLPSNKQRLQLLHRQHLCGHACSAAQPCQRPFHRPSPYTHIMLLDAPSHANVFCPRLHGCRRGRTPSHAPWCWLTPLSGPLA